MTWIIFGDDQFRAHERVRELRGQNPIILEVPPASLDEILRHTETGSLFEKSRTVVVRSFFQNSEVGSVRRLIGSLERTPKEVTLIFWEEGPWKLTEAQTKPLRKVVRFLGFPALRDEAVRTWIKERVVKSGGEIKDDAAHLLSGLVGSDLSRAASEVDKLVSGGSTPIDIELVSRLVSGDIPVGVFALLDSIAAKDPSAPSVLAKLLESGEEPLRLLSLLTTLSRNLLLIDDAGEKATASALGMHPFVFQKTKAAAQNFRYEELYEFHRRILSTDIAIKTGRMDPGEALSVLIASLTLSPS